MYFLELYYKNYKERCNEKYWEDPISLPYAVMVRKLDERQKFEKMLRADGFECVVGENSYPCMYVNFTLKRYGRSVKACVSTAINREPMPLDIFLRDIYFRWHTEEAFRTELENNYILSARICLDKSLQRLKSHNESGLFNGDYMRRGLQEIDQYIKFITDNT